MNRVSTIIYYLQKTLLYFMGLNDTPVAPPCAVIMGLAVYVLFGQG